MKNKIMIILYMLIFSFTLVGCNQESASNPIDSKDEIYELAVESGYIGTYEEWINLVKGENGVGIQSITLTSSFNDVDIYTITFTDGSFTTYQVKNGTNGIKGDKGDKGDQGDKGEQGEPGLPGANGNSIISIVLTDRNELVDTYTITYSDNSFSIFKITNGKKGDKGEKGEKGDNGITPKIRINEVTNFWEVSYDNGLTWNSLGVKATSDSIGPKGESAFEIFKKYHPDYNGTEEDWINSIYKSGLYYNENAPETGEFKFAKSFEGDSYYLISYTGGDYSISIPDTYNGYPVTKIGTSAFVGWEHKSGVSLTLPSSFEGTLAGKDSDIFQYILYINNKYEYFHMSLGLIKCDSTYFLENFASILFYANGKKIISIAKVMEVSMSTEEFIVNYLNEGFYSYIKDPEYSYVLSDFKIKCRDGIINNLIDNNGTLSYEIELTE